MSQRRIQRREPQLPDDLPVSLHPVLRRVLRNRGVGNARDADLGLAGLLSFETLKGLPAAVDLLLQAIHNQWHVCVIGDYDADGATSTALMMSVLPRLGIARSSYLVPDRFRYGYGLSPEIVALAAERKPDLLVTVDNGIASLEGVEAAQHAGMRVLITDHHLPGAKLPPADAIVNPNQSGCEFPSKSLAGVGVAFYLLLALRARRRALGQGDGPPMAAWLDLVALGTVADVASLDHNNRILVEQGLRQLRAGRGRPGIRALLEIAGRDPGKAVAADLGFVAGPRLNAAGRLDDMTVGIECLLTEDETRAHEIACRLDQFNRERREIQQQMQAEALESLAAGLANRRLPAALCVFDPAWHQGVIGLVAGKLKERYHRPTVAFAPADVAGEMLKGSARSIPGFHIRDALDSIATRHPGLIMKFGGHAMAAGLSLDRARLEDFRLALEQEAGDKLDEQMLEGRIDSDGELAPEDLGLPLADGLRTAGPWGQGFPEPSFDGLFEVSEAKIVGERHLKLRLRSPGGNQSCSAIAFNQIPDVPVGSRIRAVYRLGINEYNDSRKAELLIDYLESADQADVR